MNHVTNVYENHPDPLFKNVYMVRSTVASGYTMALKSRF